MKKISVAKIFLIAPYLAWIFFWLYLLISWNEWNFFITNGKATIGIVVYTIVPLIAFFFLEYFFYKRQRYLLSIAISIVFIIVGYGLYVVLNNTFNPCAIALGCGDNVIPLPRASATLGQ